MTPAETLSIIVEGPSDAAILRAILAKDQLAPTRFYGGRGKISHETVGRNILVHEGGAVLIVMDADTLNPRRAEEEESLSRLALRNMAPHGNFDVFAFVPEIEVVFFEAPQILEQMLSRPISREKLAVGLLTPKKTLTDLLAEKGAKFDLDKLLSSLDAQTAQALRGGKQFRVLVEKLEKLLKSFEANGKSSGADASAAKV